MLTIYTFSSLRDVDSVHRNIMHWNVIDISVFTRFSWLHHRCQVVKIKWEANYGEWQAFFQLFPVQILFHDALAVKMRWKWNYHCKKTTNIQRRVRRVLSNENGGVFVVPLKGQESGCQPLFGKGARTPLASNVNQTRKGGGKRAYLSGCSASKEPKTKNLNTRLWGITTRFVGFFPESLVLRSTVSDSSYTLHPHDMTVTFFLAICYVRFCLEWTFDLCIFSIQGTIIDIDIKF